MANGLARPLPAITVDLVTRQQMFSGLLENQITDGSFIELAGKLTRIHFMESLDDKDQARHLTLQLHRQMNSEAELLRRKFTLSALRTKLSEYWPAPK